MGKPTKLTSWQEQQAKMIDSTARPHAEASRREFLVVKRKQLALVRQEQRTKRQALDSMQRAYEKLRATYLRIPCTTYGAWDEHGPKRDWDEVVRAAGEDAVWDRLVDTFDARAEHA